MDKNSFISIIKNDLNKLLSLFKINIDLNDQGDTILMYACSINNFDFVKRIIDNNTDVNEKNNNGATALMLACRSKANLDIVKYLVSECNADVNIKNNNGTTALMLACGTEDNLDIVKYLVEEGKAEVNAVDKNGITALTIACEKAHKIAEYLISEGGADLELKDSEGNELPFYKYLTSFIKRLYF